MNECPETVSHPPVTLPSMSSSHQPNSRKEPAANPQQNTHRGAQHPTNVDAFAEAIRIEAIRLLSFRGRHAFDADDIAQEIVLRFLLFPNVYMAHYTPVSFARVCLGQVSEDVARKNRAGRGEGANLESYIDECGQPAKRARREVISGYAPAGEGDRQVFDTVLGHVPPVDEFVIEQVDGQKLLEQALSKLNPNQKHLFVEVVGHGRTVVDVAKEMGIRRETASRVLKSARKVLATLGGAS